MAKSYITYVCIMRILMLHFVLNTECHNAAYATPVVEGLWLIQCADCGYCRKSTIAGIIGQRMSSMLQLLDYLALHLRLVINLHGYQLMMYAPIIDGLRHGLAPNEILHNYLKTKYIIIDNYYLFIFLVARNLMVIW